MFFSPLSWTLVVINEEKCAATIFIMISPSATPAKRAGNIEKKAGLASSFSTRTVARSCRLDRAPLMVTTKNESWREKKKERRTHIG